MQLSERELFEAVYRRMRTLAGALSPDLEDLSQVAAEQVFLSLPSFQGKSDLMTWVYAVCYRVLLHQRRWYRAWLTRFSFSLDDIADPTSPEPVPSALLEQRRRTVRLHAALGRMSDKYRAVVVLHDLEELGVPEIAAIVGANELTVRSRLRDGRKQLHRLLEADPQFDCIGARHEVGI